MIPTKFLWSALAGTTSVIILLVSAWAHDITNRNTDLESRVSITEQHYAAIQSDIQDLREHMKDVEHLLQEGRK